MVTEEDGGEDEDSNYDDEARAKCNSVSFPVFVKTGVDVVVV